MSVLRIARAAGLWLALGGLLAGCGSINTSLTKSMADNWPAWAGGMPPNMPPRPGAPGYDEYLTQLKANAIVTEQTPAVAEQTPAAPAPKTARATPAARRAPAQAARPAPVAALPPPHAYAPPATDLSESSTRAIY